MKKLIIILILFITHNAHAGYSGNLSAWTMAKSTMNPTIFVAGDSIAAMTSGYGFVTENYTADGKTSLGLKANPPAGYTCANGADEDHSGIQLSAWVKGTSCDAKGFGYDCIIAKNPGVVVISAIFNGLVMSPNADRAISYYVAQQKQLFRDLRNDLPRARLYFMSYYMWPPTWYGTTDSIDTGGCNCRDFSIIDSPYTWAEDNCDGEEVNCVPKVNGMLTKYWADLLADTELKAMNVGFIDARQAVIDEYGDEQTDIIDFFEHTVFASTTELSGGALLHIPDSGYYYSHFVKPAFETSLRTTTLR